MDILSLFMLTIFTYTLTRLYRFHHNYTLAGKTGLHIICAPLDPYGTFWQIIGPMFMPLLHKSPFFLTKWCRALDLTWSWRDGYMMHEKFGASFLVVHPGNIVLVTADPETITTVLGRRNEFVKGEMYEPLNLFGKNVDTVNGPDWSRHRKLTAPCFNERISSLVWSESLVQATSMLQKWLQSHPNHNHTSYKINTVVDDTRIVALHVLSTAGFGIRQDFHGGATTITAGHTMSYRDALMTVLGDLFTLLVGLWRVKALVPWLPRRVKNVGVAVKEFRQYMDEMVERERGLLQEKNGAMRPNLIATLIRTSDEAINEGIGAKSSIRLSDDEIRGNIFIFNLAGHDTTANTLAFAFSLLALHPESQKWVQEELDEVMDSKGSDTYEDTFPKLKRTMATVYETLRLYGPVPTIPRSTSAHLSPTLIPIPLSPSKSITLPRNTPISLNLYASHISPHHPLFSAENGDTFDALSFRPSRWINADSNELLPMPHGFQPWSSGPRICPGMKFAQVEAVGVLATVLKRVTVDVDGPAEDSNEGKEEEKGFRALGKGEKNAMSVDGEVESLVRDGDKAIRREIAKSKLRDVLKGAGFSGASLAILPERKGEVWLRVSERESHGGGDRE
ncbi:cytochrome P450 [Delitschia confertaspora ATCC 74209]|uniref:Cytochrome P450 n=1 Tax=Delitschia confertaspora ATCC 74209 TaxID=1513339 RepID=A0A9P4MSR6_9PLEO|nr:cytochrome P450 [Delitschia confertaspora ATCC 74209]